MEPLGALRLARRRPSPPDRRLMAAAACELTHIALAKHLERDADHFIYDEGVIEAEIAEVEARVIALERRVDALKGLNRLAQIATAVAVGDMKLEFDPRDYGLLMRAIHVT